MKIGAELKAQREKAGYSQFQLSKLTGVAQATISRWEDDKRVPNVESCVILADFYGITLDELIGREIKKNWQ